MSERDVAVVGAMVERVARAIYSIIDASGSDPWDAVMERRKKFAPFSGPEVTRSFELARAAINAMRNPTDGMLDAVRHGDWDPLSVWQDMIAEALR